MWRLNINTELLAESGGLTGETLFFEREGQDTYQFKILTYSEAKALRNVSENTGGVGETRTREYGWY